MNSKIIKKIEGDSKKLVVKLDKNLDLRKNLKHTRKYLDFGCGYGNVTYFLARKFPKIEIKGLDMDKERIKVAKSKYCRKNCSFMVSKKITKKYDAVSVFFVLHELTNFKKNLKMIFNSLTRKGKFIVYDFRKNTKKKFKELYDKNPQLQGTFKDEYEEHNKWSLEDFEKIMLSIGFKTIKLKKDRDYWLMYIGEKS